MITFPHKPNSESVRGEAGTHSLRGRKPQAGSVAAMIPAGAQGFSRKSFERNAVITCCGIRLRGARPACYAEAGRRRQRTPREQCAITASLEVSCPGNSWIFAAADFGGMQGARRKHIAGSVCDRRATPHVGKRCSHPKGLNHFRSNKCLAISGTGHQGKSKVFELHSEKPRTAEVATKKFNVFAEWEPILIASRRRLCSRGAVSATAFPALR